MRTTLSLSEYSVCNLKWTNVVSVMRSLEDRFHPARRLRTPDLRSPSEP